MSALLDSALELAELGIPVFPLKSNKRPCQEGAFHDASSDPETVRRLFADPLASLIGVPTGAASGIDILDIDPKSGGDLWLRENEHRLPAARRHHTRSGGVHLFFVHTAGMANSASRIAPGVDVRGAGGYFVWWPAAGFFVTGDAWATWPAWLLLDALRNINPNTPAVNAEELSPPDADSLLRLLAIMPNPAETTRDEYTSVNLAIQGCVRALEALNRLDDPTPIYDAAAEWSARWDSADAGDFQAERARWDDDWSTRDRDVSGWRHLLSMAGKLGADVAAFRLADVAAEFGALPDEPETPGAARPAALTPARAPAELSVTEPTEAGTALGFAKDMHGRVAYDHSAGAWTLWDAKAGAWIQDTTGRGFATILEFVAQTRALFGGGEKALAAISFASAVERAAKTDPRLAVSSGVWDPDPWLLGVPGGVVNLRTGVLQNADPAHRITKQTKVAPANPGTVAPLWLAFLASATGGDASFVAYLQRLVGYCLTGDVSEEMLAFPYGPGGTGKGTLFGTVASIIGAYGLQMPIETFSKNSRQNPEYARARMVGARMVMASETESASGWAESSLKEFSGNEGTISAREPYGKMFNYRPQFKILILGNHAPALKGRDTAMERRLHVIPFEHPPAVRDATLKARLRAEWPAILRWMIDGCLLWQRDGLGMCRAVEAASRAYFEEQDSLKAWAAERLEIGAGCRAKRADLFSDFSAWCRANGEPASSAHEFYESVCRSLNLNHAKGADGVRYLKGADIRKEGRVIPAAEFSDVSALLH
ncbi:MAG TPA: hypothetical protein DDZ81_11075 [Acetobacteraceae bacterium]|jgi:putative DNA primase/helicase|nr:hypothetical protein [Acetobacteraceae bacterium]